MPTDVTWTDRKEGQTKGCSDLQGLESINYFKVARRHTLHGPIDRWNTHTEMMDENVIAPGHIFCCCAVFLHASSLHEPEQMKHEACVW